MPKRYINNGSELSYCENNIEITNGQLLSSGTSIMSRQLSCMPNTGNAGNLYSWDAANIAWDIKTELAYDSICPKSWMLSYATIDNFYKGLFVDIYDISTDRQSELLMLPFSMIKAGYYSNRILLQNEEGHYWYAEHSSRGGAFASSFVLSEASYTILQSAMRDSGLSLRCFLGRWGIFDNRGGEASKRARCFRKDFWVW